MNSHIYSLYWNCSNLRANTLALIHIPDGKPDTGKKYAFLYLNLLFLVLSIVLSLAG
jgi:hypothetical protein